MKIAHIVSTYPPYYGGMGNVVFQTVSELSKIGHEVVVLTPQYKSIPIKEDEVEYAKRLRPSIEYGKAARIPQIKKELDFFDLVHLHYPFFGTAQMVSKWKMRNPDKKLVITYHMDTRSPGWKGFIFKYYAKYWMPKILGSADKIIVSSFDYAEASDASAIFKNNKEKWEELPFGVDIDRFKPREKPNSLFERHELDPNKPTLLFVGGMDVAHYFKGIPILLKSVGMLRKSMPDLQVVLIGDGELKQQFELKASAYGLKRNIRFVGGVADDELPYYYNMADLFVLPSINRGEAFGMVLLEAMASGVPVVASDLPGVRTVAMDGGLVTEPNKADELAEAIFGFFSENIDRNDWQDQVRSICEQKYSLQVITERLDNIYKSIYEGV